MNGEISRPPELMSSRNPCKSFENAIHKAVEAELAELAKSDANGGGKSKVKGPWLPEQDEALTRLVKMCGPRNWNLISRGIPGRSGKSCRLRWCNQLDPILKRKPFSGKTRFSIFFLILLDSRFLLWSISLDFSLSMSSVSYC